MSILVLFYLGHFLVLLLEIVMSDMEGHHPKHALVLLRVFPTPTLSGKSRPNFQYLLCYSEKHDTLTYFSFMIRLKTREYRGNC